MKTATIDIKAPSDQRFPDILTPNALTFLSRLHNEVEPERDSLLENRAQVAERLRNGGTLDFLEDMTDIREDGEWRIKEVPHDLRVRKVEITGPTDRKMIINALNSGASVFMADFEDANAPTWRNMVEGQQNLIDAIERKITFTSPEGKQYRLNDRTATLVVRPRGWHLPERHLMIDGLPIAGAIFDFGLYAFHNAERLLKRMTGPYFYLPKLESHREARLWNEIFDWTEKELHIDHGSIKATVLVEVLPLAFEMDDALYQLRDHSAGLNAGRWDYMFSIIKKLGHRKEFVLPDRAQVTMTVPFMRAYTERLVKTCHKRGGDQQPHGGRRHGGDLALADLAMGPSRHLAGRRPARDRAARARRRARGAREDRQRRRRGLLRDRPLRRRAEDLRAGRAVRRLPGVPHDPRVRAHRLGSRAVDGPAGIRTDRPVRTSPRLGPAFMGSSALSRHPRPSAAAADRFRGVRGLHHHD